MSTYLQHTGCESPVVPCFSSHRPTLEWRGKRFSHFTSFREAKGRMLLRKEVIQPHLPVRLPCYDFVPIASPTFDHSLPNGLGRGLRVLPTFVT